MEAIKLPLISISSEVIFPKISYSINLRHKEGFVAAHMAIKETGRRVIVGFCKSAYGIEALKMLDVGCECIIKDGPNESVKLDGGVKGVISVNAIRCVKILTVHPEGPFCLFEPIEEPVFEMTAHFAELAMYLQSLASTFDGVTFQPLVRPATAQELSTFVSYLAAHAKLSLGEKKRLIATSDPRKRLEILHMTLVQIAEKENEIIAERAEKETHDEKRAEDRTTKVERSEKPADAKETELGRLRRLIQEADMPEEARAVATGELKRLQMMSPSTADFSVSLTYLDTIASLPWSKLSPDKLDIEEAKKVLDEDHYGLEKPKERILEFLAVRKLTEKGGGAILCFAGPPGCGKTSLGQSIARAMGRTFIRSSFGGIRDEAEIRGHRRTYIGALPGRILQEMRKAKVRNPVFMLDEIDKLCSDRVHGDPASALLEVLDPEQNHSFKDNYLGLPFDLSQVFFIGTANETHNMPQALRDRLEIIDVPGYSAFAKAQIARRHLIPKQKEKNGLGKIDTEISDGALGRLIEEYTCEAGVRNLERHCGSVFRKLAVQVASGKEVQKVVEADQVDKLLGPPKAFPEKMASEPRVGVSTGMAWSTAGGSILFIESVAIAGDGKVELTGNLGQVLQESAKAAHTWIRSNAEMLGIDSEMVKKNIHVHIPAGAIPKDGPSAGVALSASIASLLSNRPVRNDLSMTGEISLSGRVLPVGGIVEKLLAAHRAGIRESIIPKDNGSSLQDVPEEVLKEMKIHLVDRLSEALKIALL